MMGASPKRKCAVGASRSLLEPPFARRSDATHRLRQPTTVFLANFERLPK
jgi:hypothetical protein